VTDQIAGPFFFHHHQNMTNLTAPDQHQLAHTMTLDQHAEHCGNYLMFICHKASSDAGWWHSQTGIDLAAEMRSGTRYGKALAAEKLCLVHSEVSEAMEGHRKGLQDDKLKHRPMIEVELADAVIRIADLAGALGLNLGGAIAEKMAFNAKRPDHKPEARAAAGGKSY
jgi:NTP pyrophosphatase (non-canonical NTP hydrolase)